MKQLADIETLKRICLQKYFVMPPKITISEPMVLVNYLKGQPRLTFHLKKRVRRQRFLGIYPAAATLPEADRLRIGDYALLQSGEILQIL